MQDCSDSSDEEESEEKKACRVSCLHAQDPLKQDEAHRRPRLHRQVHLSSPPSSMTSSMYALWQEKAR